MQGQHSLPLLTCALLHISLQTCMHACRDGCEPEDASSSLALSSLDTVYHWAAFNKLLLLGLYAPVEEAAAPEQQRQVAVGQLQQLAAAREVRSGDGGRVCACGFGVTEALSSVQGGKQTTGSRQRTTAGIWHT